MSPGSQPTDDERRGMELSELPDPKKDFRGAEALLIRIGMWTRRATDELFTGATNGFAETIRFATARVRDVVRFTEPMIAELTELPLPDFARLLYSRWGDSHEGAPRALQGAYILIHGLVTSAELRASVSEEPPRAPMPSRKNALEAL
ncbi:MAG: hypothetical protein ACYS9X_31100, partial [Planctomycetota bacterium]